MKRDPNFRMCYSSEKNWILGNEKFYKWSGIRFTYTNQPLKPANFLLPYWYTPSFTDTFYKVLRVLKQVISSVSKLPFALLSERATQNLLATWPGMRDFVLHRTDLSKQFNSSSLDPGCQYQSSNEVNLLREGVISNHPTF